MLRFKHFIPGIVLIILSVLLLFLARAIPSFAEVYARNIYPVFPRTIGWFFGLFPFSFFEVGVIIIFLGIIYAIVYAIIDAFRPKRRMYLIRRLKRWPVVIVYFLTIVFFMFVLTAGINYERESFADHIGIEVRESSVLELVDMYLILVNRANMLASRVVTNESGHFYLHRDDLYPRATRTMENLHNTYGGLVGFFPRAVSPFFSAAMSHTRITGFFSPWTLEAHYNRQMPEQSIPFVILHELAHLSGYMQEDEANFIAYLAGRDSIYIDFQYSAVYNAISYTLRALRQVTTPEEYAELFSLLPEQIRRDLSFASSFWQQFQGRPAEVSQRVNDAYLRANRVFDGVMSYGRIVDLLLAYYNRVDNALD